MDVPQLRRRAEFMNYLAHLLRLGCWETTRRDNRLFVLDPKTGTTWHLDVHMGQSSVDSPQRTDDATETVGT